MRSFQKVLSRATLAAFVVAMSSAISHAYVVDGLLSDWGVTLFSDWVPNSPTTDWAGGVGENNYGGLNNSLMLASFGGERFDVEAMYMDDDPLFLYFAVVTSFPQNGVDMSGIHFLTGDLALDLWSGGDYGYEYGVKMSGAGFGNVVQNPTWSLPHGGFGFPDNAPSEFAGGTVLGTASVVYADSGIFDNGYTNYVIEGAISKDLIGGPGHHDVNLHWTMSCGNDAINVHGDLDNPVPEPATVVLLGTGLLGFGLAALRRKAFRS
jgi:hypothetical protein